MKKRIYILFIFLTSIIYFGCTDSETEPTNNPPTCSIISPENGTEIKRGEIITISVNADDKDGNISSVHFYIDNNEISSNTSFPYNYEWATFNTSLGNHIIKVLAADNSGNSKSDSVFIQIIDAGPVAEFAVNQTTVYLDSSIQFTDQSANLPTSWLWDFGDGTTSTSQNPLHSYSRSGNYDVSLTATSKYGSNRKTKTNYITATFVYGSVTDIDGNVYNTMTFGTQTWMAENLKATHYPNGEEIVLVEEKYDWDTLSWSAKAMCYYDNSSINANTYGALYTWGAAKDACPTGWHLPSDAEWKQLEIFLGMSQEAADSSDRRGTNEGSKLAANSPLWYGGKLDIDPEYGTSGFEALPAGERDYNGFVYSLSKTTFFWSGTVYMYSLVWYRDIGYNSSKITRRNEFNNSGFSVRCVKD